MAEAENSSQFKENLLGMINAISRVIPMPEQDQVLIVLLLNTDEKIHKWFEWLRPRITGENELDATEAEIVRAAVQIDKRIL